MKSKRKVKKLYEKIGIRQKGLGQYKKSLNRERAPMKELSITSKIDSLLFDQKKTIC